MRMSPGPRVLPEEPLLSLFFTAASLSSCSSSKVTTFGAGCRIATVSEAVLVLFGGGGGAGFAAAADDADFNFSIRGWNCVLVEFENRFRIKGEYLG